MQNTPLNHWPPYIWAYLVFLRLQVSTRASDQILTYMFTICQFLLAASLLHSKTILPEFGSESRPMMSPWYPRKKRFANISGRVAGFPSNLETAFCRTVLQ